MKISYLHDLVLQVQDNGKGFESRAVNTEIGRWHFGLVGMYERAARNWRQVNDLQFAGRRDRE